jgi:hypothetical protein
MTFNYSGRLEFNNLADLLENPYKGLYYWLETTIGWTLHNTVVSGTGATDKIFKSTGEDGTEVIYIRLTQSGTQTLLFRTATFYHTDPASVLAQNETGKNSDNWNKSVWNNAPLIAYFSGNRDCFAIATYQNPYFGVGIFGIPKRTIPARYSGRTTLTTGDTVDAAGTPTTLEVGSTANMTVGQKLFVINTANTANRGNLLRCTLTGIPDPTHITVTNDYGTATAFDAGALIGLDPMPTFIPRMDNSSASSYGFAPNRGFCFLYNAATLQMTGAAQTDPQHNVAQGAFYNTEVYEFSVDYYTYANPSSQAGAIYEASPIWPVAPILLVGTRNYAGNFVGKQMRGRIDRVCFFPNINPLVAWGDTMINNDITYLVCGYRTTGDYSTAELLLRTVA